MDFGPATAAWFSQTFDGPTAVQQKGWPLIASGVHSLLIAPTGSGKTLAAFLWALDRLSQLPAEGPAGVRVVYVSPLKALVYDIERNLRAPRVGIERAAERASLAIRKPSVAVRTGDTTQRMRRHHVRHPSDILVTTPESLYLILTSGARETLRTVETVIVDEIHAMAATKRGAHLALTLERLAHECEADPQRIGLSATVRPLDDVARFLGGDRPVEIVDTSEVPRLDLRIVVPVPDMTNPMSGWSPAEEGGDGRGAEDDVEGGQAEDGDEHTAFEGEESSAEESGWQGGSILAQLAASPDPERRASIWPAIYDELLQLIQSRRSTIVFVNSRGLCERLAQRLNELAGEELVLAHHGSIAHKQRTQIEEMLKRGELRALVATSSLELGIDMGAVDLVVLVESPGSVARGLQRIGRAGHQVGETSIGRIFPKHRGDLLEAAVVAREMAAGRIEALRVPKNPLDVLAQQIVAMCTMESWSVDELAALVRRTANYRDLSRELLEAVLDMLAGRYPSTDFADLRPRIRWDRERDVLEARKGAGILARVSGGTIPDRGLYGVFIGPEGPRVGELDEEMVYETRVGQTIILGASTWRVEEITRDRVLVSPAPGEAGRLPFWHGEGPGRPVELGRVLGAFARELGEKREAEAEAWLRSDYHLDERAAQNLVRYVVEQRSESALPTDRAIVVERFRDELGDWRVCILSPFGGRVHAPWAMALEGLLVGGAGFDIQSLWSDDGIVLRFADGEDLPDLDRLVPDPELVEDLVVSQLGHSALFGSQFRENAARALLMPRWRPGSRTPLWAQRLKAQQLLAVARGFPSFPVVLETYRSCLQDVFDVPALLEVLSAVRRREIRVEEVETPTASPFARSLVFAWVANYMYEGDAPLAERKVHALALDRRMLRELLGHEELRDLLDAEVIEQVEAELQGLAEDRRARNADALCDLLRRVGDLTDAELVARCAEDPEAWLATVQTQWRAVQVRIGGEPRWIAAEDVAIYRDALGVQPPAGVPAAFVAATQRPLQQLVRRWARTHGPFLTGDVARRWRIAPARVETELRELVARDDVVRGEFRPDGSDREWCDAEVLRRIRRRTLARLRNEVAPVEPEVLGRFLPLWHGVGDTRGGLGRLEEALVQLEGLPLSFRDLETAILPARVADYVPGMLDELGSSGRIVWIGHGALGKRDGRIALYRRDRLKYWLDAPEPFEPPSPLHAAILDHLATHGASFYAEIAEACGPESRKTLIEAIWDLVWAGRITNDTFRPLRSLGPVSSVRRRPRGPASGVHAHGRWSRVERLLLKPASPTEALHARVVTLLERHGLVSRQVADIEAIPGGFSSIYPVLREMEDVGRVRRGYFVEGLGGAQFAYAGAVDRLRGCRTTAESPRVQLLAATDPANPFGWLIDWPPVTAEIASPPRRAAGAFVVIVEGEAVLYLERGGRRLITFPAVADGDTLVRAAGSLRQVAAHSRGKLLRIEEIDGEPARTSERAEGLKRAAFRSDYRGLTLEGREPRMNTDGS